MEDPQFTVLLTGSAYSGPAALRAIGAVTGLSLWHGRQLLASAPAVVQADIPHENAVRVADRLRRAEVRVAVRCDFCRRTLPEDGALVDPGPCASRYWPTAHCQANSETVCDLDRCPIHHPGQLLR